MAWHKVLISVDQVVSGIEIQIQNQFEILFMAAGTPKDMALFGSGIKDHGVELYFSPGALQYAKGLIQLYNGTECEKPTANDIALLVGHADARKRLLNLG